MKKTVFLLTFALLLCLSCSSCRALEPASEEKTASAPADTETRLAYYQTMVGTLNEELLALRQELYIRTVEYEARVAALEDALRQSNATPPAVAPTPSPETLYRYRKTLEGVEILDYLGSAQTLILPEQIEGSPVVSLGERAFAENSTLSAVVLPESLRSVGWFCFYGCVSLSSVTLGDAVESIAYGAFDNCARDLTFYCGDGSYAQQYAHSYGIGVVA